MIKLINGLKSLMKKRASDEFEVMLMESVFENQEVADAFLAESGEQTISDVYGEKSEVVTESSEESELESIISKIPESDIDDDEILQKMLEDDKISTNDLLSASEEVLNAIGL